jgi:hypothetical protein
MKGNPLLKALSQSVGRVYLWWTLEKSRMGHRSSSSDFSAFTTEEYLDSPQPFYPEIEKIIEGV